MEMRHLTQSNDKSALAGFLIKQNYSYTCNTCNTKSNDRSALTELVSAAHSVTFQHLRKDTSTDGDDEEIPFIEYMLGKPLFKMCCFHIYGHCSKGDGV